MTLFDLMRWLAKAALVLMLGYGVLCVGLYVLQRRIMFHGGDKRPDPVALGLRDIAVLSVRAADGVVLNAWYQPPPTEGGRVALFLHGNAGTIGDRAGRVPQFTAAGWGVLLLEWRGFGGNPGAPSEEGLALDARAAFDALLAMGVAPERIVIWGESLGTALSVRLGGEVTAAAVVLEAPFTSMLDMARLRYWIIPADRLLTDRFESLARISAIRAPVLVLHGSLDTQIPPDMGRRLAAAAPDGTFQLVPGATHLNLASFGAVATGTDFVTRRLAR